VEETIANKLAFKQYTKSQGVQVSITTMLMAYLWRQASQAEQSQREARSSLSTANSRASWNQDGTAKRHIRKNPRAGKIQAHSHSKLL
jgi:hypothetical protein